MTDKFPVDFSKQFPVQIVEDKIEDDFGMIRTTDGPPVEIAVLHDGAADSVETAAKLASLLGAAGIMRELLSEAAEIWAEQFDGDTQVSGADLVEWFALWRVAAKEALSSIG